MQKRQYPPYVVIRKPCFNTATAYWRLCTSKNKDPTLNARQRTDIQYCACCGERGCVGGTLLIAVFFFVPKLFLLEFLQHCEPAVINAVRRSGNIVSTPNHRDAPLVTTGLTRLRYYTLHPYVRQLRFRERLPRLCRLKDMLLQMSSLGQICWINGIKSVSSG